MTSRSMQTLLLAAIVGSVVGAAPWPARAQSPPQYRVTHTVHLGAPDRWDYVVFDPSFKRVYVAHGGEVTVVDGEKGNIVGKVTGFPGGTHGIAVVGTAGRGYTDDGEAGEAGSFDLATLSVTGRIKAAEDADAVTYDAASGHVFVVNGDTGTLTVIDPKSNSAVGTIQGGGKLEYAVASGHGELYVNGAGKREVVRIDTHTNQVTAHWPVPDCTSPHGLAIDPVTRRLFVSCLNKLLMVVDAENGKVIERLPIGAGTDAAAFDPKRRLIFSSNGIDGTLSIIRENDANSFTSLGEIKTAPTARTMGIDAKTGRLYLAAADIAADAPAQTVTDRRRPRLIPGSLKLIFLDPVD
jgi:DNA-binding beta-propeller fold protein YncE